MTQTVWYVPIEPLPERYSEQWYRNFPKAFQQAGFNVNVVEGPKVSDEVKVGTFLDMNSTMVYKAGQIQVLARLFEQKQIQDHDIIFFGDVEFWGIEGIRLMAQMNGVNVNMVGFLHAASYTHEDAFEIAASYQKYTELGWLGCLDFVYVGSEYHKRAVIERRIEPFADEQDKGPLIDRIVVTGNPMFAEDYDNIKSKNLPKKKQIVISNRFDWEKRPNISLDFACILKDRNPDLEIVVCTSRKKFTSNKEWLEQYARVLEKQGVITIKAGLTKDEYHTILAESRIMLTNSIEENFGYCVAEALYFNTLPLMKADFSHPELVEGDPLLLFDDEDEIVDRVELMLSKYTNLKVDHYTLKYQAALKNMTNHMREEL